MRLAPQPRLLFQHRNLQKWSEHVVSLAFLFPNVLRATSACTFPTSQPPKVVRTWCVSSVFTSTCASRHNGVHVFDISTSKSAPTLRCCAFWLGNMLRATTACTFSTSHLASWLRTRRFSEPTFRPSGATNHWKNTVFCDFPTFSRTWIFLLERLSLF